MKKFLAMLLMLLAALGCTACSDSWVGFMKSGSEMAALTQLQQTGEVVLDVDWNEGAALDVLNNFDDVRFTFKTEADNRKLQFKLAGELAIGDEKLPLTMYMDKAKLYFKTDELIALYQLTDPENAEALVQLAAAFGDAEWLCVEMMDEESWTEYQKALLDGDISVEQVYDEAIDLMAALKSPYAALDSKLLTKKGNTYTLQLDNESTAAFVKDFLFYTLNNSEKIAAALAGWVDGCDLIDDSYKAELKSTIYAGVTYAQSLTDANFHDLDSTILTGISSWPFEFDLRYTLTRNSAKSFDVGFVLDYQTKNVGTLRYNTVDAAKLTAKATTTGVQKVNIDIPTAKVLNADDIKTDGFTPNKVGATIYLDEDYMYYHHHYALPMLDDSGTNTPNVRIINGSTYLGLRPVAEACGEEVGWDSSKKSAYVVRGDNRIYVTGYIDAQEGRSYLKIRDFEKLGYTVTYEKTEITGQIVTLER